MADASIDTGVLPTGHPFARLGTGSRLVLLLLLIPLTVFGGWVGYSVARELARALVDPVTAQRALRAQNLLLAYHDRSDGGLFATLCEMAFAGHPCLGTAFVLGALLFLVSALGTGFAFGVWDLVFERE